jgi:hypothetical protein
MRIFLALICSLALACVAGGAQKEEKENKKKKKAAPAAQVSKPAAGKVTGKLTGAGKPAKAGKQAQAGGPGVAGKPAKASKSAKAEQPAGATKAAKAGKPAKAEQPAGATKAAKAGKPAVAGGAAGKPFKPQRFNLASKSKPSTSVAPAVNFQQSRRIQGSDRWVGSNYRAFRDYRSEWHDRDWWRHNHSRLTFVFGGWYFWNAGYWYPAWGYDPGAYYAYDGPIYAYNDLPPDQVVANVQAALQQQGYYRGEVDGLLGPLTRAAIADYQRDRGLYITSAIDRPTLESLGMT